MCSFHLRNLLFERRNKKTKESFNFRISFRQSYYRKGNEKNKSQLNYVPRLWNVMNANVYKIGGLVVVFREFINMSRRFLPFPSYKIHFCFHDEFSFPYSNWIRSLLFDCFFWMNLCLLKWKNSFLFWVLKTLS